MFARQSDTAALDAAIRAHPDFDAVPDRHSQPAAGPPIRATRKAAEWGAAIYRAYAYVAGRVREDWQRTNLDELLAQTIAAGPDFAKVRANAAFAPVPIVAYSRAAAAEILQQAREIERESYASRDKGKHGGGLGRMALQLLEWFCFTLWPRASRYGMTPSLAHIAADARMSRATVVDAMKRLELFGFLTIQRRRKRVPTPLGAKVVQDCSAYVLSLARGLGALALAALGKKPPAPASEFSKSPAIRNEHLSSMPQPSDWFPKQDYEPLIE